MTPGTRFRLSICNSTIQFIEKNLPHHRRVSSITLGPTHLKIDDTEFVATLLKVYTGVKSEFDEEIDMETREVDRYGLPDRSDYHNQEVKASEERIEQANFRLWKNRVKNHSERLEKKKLDEKSCDLSEEYFEQRILDNQKRLYKYNLRENNQDPPYVFYLKIRVSSPGEPELTETVLFNKKIREALGYLQTKIFGGRAWLKLQNFETLESNIRLPLEFLSTLAKFEVGNLKIGGQNCDYTLDAFKDSGPLESLQTGSTNLAHPLIRSSRMLTLTGPVVITNRNIWNLRVHFRSSIRDPEPNQVSTLIWQWQHHHDPVGKYYSICFRGVRTQNPTRLAIDRPEELRAENPRDFLSQLLREARFQTTVTYVPSAIRPVNRPRLTFAISEATEINVWFEDVMENGQKQCDLHVRVDEKGYAERN